MNKTTTSSLPNTGPKPAARASVLLVALTLGLVGACSSGGDGDRGDLDLMEDTTTVTTTVSPQSKTTSAGSTPPTNQCTPKQADSVGDGFDPDACVTLGSDSASTLFDDTVWASGDTRVIAFDAASGTEVFRSDPVPDAIGIDSIAIIEVDGEKLLAAMFAVRKEGDAVNAPSDGWQLLAWPADGTGSTEPVIDAYGEVPEGSADTINSDTFWGNRGALIADLYVPYDDPKFQTYKFITEYVLPGSGDAVTPPEPFYVGTAQDVSLGFLELADPNQNNPKDVAGFFAVGPDGKELWNHLSFTPAAGLFAYDGPTHVEAVWGDYALDITMKEEGNGGDVKWYDAKTGKEATPAPDELAGANVRGEDSVVATPDGKYLAFKAGITTWILDVASGELTSVDSENELTPTAIISTTLYVTGNGAGIVDVTTGEATAMKKGTAPIAVSKSYGLFTADSVVAAPVS